MAYVVDERVFRAGRPNVRLLEMNQRLSMAASCRPHSPGGHRRAKPLPILAIGAIALKVPNGIPPLAALASILHFSAARLMTRSRIGIAQSSEINARSIAMIRVPTVTNLSPFLSNATRIA